MINWRLCEFFLFLSIYCSLFFILYTCWRWQKITEKDDDEMKKESHLDYCETHKISFTRFVPYSIRNLLSLSLQCTTNGFITFCAYIIPKKNSRSILVCLKCFELKQNNAKKCFLCLSWIRNEQFHKKKRNTEI